MRGHKLNIVVAHLYRILRSTDNRSGIDPVYGDPGVDSSMNLPYSGWNAGTEILQSY